MLLIMLLLLCYSNNSEAMEATNRNNVGKTNQLQVADIVTVVVVNLVVAHFRFQLKQGVSGLLWAFEEAACWYVVAHKKVLFGCCFPFLFSPLSHLLSFWISPRSKHCFSCTCILCEEKRPSKPHLSTHKHTLSIYSLQLNEPSAATFELSWQLNWLLRRFCARFITYNKDRNQRSQNQEIEIELEGFKTSCCLHCCCCCVFVAKIGRL